MKFLHIIFTIVFIFLSIHTSKAKLLLLGSETFKHRVENYLDDASRHPHLRLLIHSAKTSSSTITIKPITNNKTTWHRSGKKPRSHTEAIDSKRRGHARANPTNSIIFINKNRIKPKHKSYGRGTLIHELVHANDLANGIYNKDYSIREKRAVFFQNIWSQLHRSNLRTSYHKRFPTIEYQNAIASNTVNQFIDYYFIHNDIP